MKRFRQKLHSRRGASILLALLLTLVASMVCAVVLSASVTTARRVYDDRQQEQDYLTVSSAGRLIVEYLRAHSSYRTVTYSDAVVGMHVEAGSEATYQNSAAGFPQLGDLTRSVGPSNRHTLKLDLPDGLDDVVMVFTVENADQLQLDPAEADYLIKGTIAIADASGGQDPARQRCFLSGNLKVTTTEDPCAGYKYEKSGEKDDDGNDIWEWRQYDDGACTTVVWTLEDNILLATAEDMLW